jgi:hypothetical protein
VPIGVGAAISPCGGEAMPYADVESQRQKDTLMPWFLALQSTASMTNQPSVYELQDGVDVDKISEELVSSATLDRAVRIPAVLQQSTGAKQSVNVYIRPAAWGMWMFYQLSEEERRQAMAQNPLLNALSQAAQQQRGGS